MKAVLKKIKRKLKKAWNEIKVFKPANYGRSRYFWYREHCPLQEKVILLESLQGSCPADNVLAVLKELVNNEAYKEYAIYLSGAASIKISRKQYVNAQCWKKRVKLLTAGTASYYKVLATAKYLMTEDAFIHIFAKREGQIYLNTWHGTPLMTLGKSKKMDYAMVGNEQKNFLDADYLLCPNEFTRDCFLQDYMLENFGKAKLLLAGYPRNEIFADTERRGELRKGFGWEEKQVIAYLPTWRKNTKDMPKELRAERIQKLLTEWDAALTEHQLVLVKQHHINVAPLDFSTFSHIRPFPEGSSVYEVLHASDLLVTDYSSVLFDYALTGRKTVLFTYDRAEFEEVRGLHFSLEELPFPKVETVEELKTEVLLPKAYDDSAFLEKFCSYDKQQVTRALCRTWISGEESALIKEEEIPYNGKKNILVYMGGFEKNGLTTAGANLLNTLDRTKYNYAVLYCITSVAKRQDSIRVLPEDMARIGFYHYRALTFTEQIPYMLWRGFRSLSYSFISRIMDKLSIRGMERLFGSCRLDTVVQFTGYNDEMIGIMEKAPCNRIIYVHNDMEQEIKHRANANQGLLSHAYKNYNSVAAVTEDIIPAAERIAASDREADKSAHIFWCKNVIDHNRIRTMGAEELRFDEATVINTEEEKLLAAVNSSKKKFVSIGRYSVEKGHERLIKAFERLHQQDPDTCLVIIGGHGDLWKKTVEQVENSTCPEAVFLVRYMSNPYPLLAKCDYFILSSLYEGFGLVLVEADILGLPCFSTDITGPRRFMQKYNGRLVADSDQGILEGMQECLQGKIPEKLTVDYDEYNREAIAQFEALI